MLISLTEMKPQEPLHIPEQILYQTLNALWILTFNDKIKKKFKKRVLVRNLCNIIRLLTKDKNYSFIPFDLKEYFT